MLCCVFMFYVLLMSLTIFGAYSALLISRSPRHLVTAWNLSYGLHCNILWITLISNRGAAKSLARPERKQANVSVRMEWISFDALPCRKRHLTARVSILLKSRASLKCFRACFLHGRVKDLSALRYKAFCSQRFRPANLWAIAMSELRWRGSEFSYFYVGRSVVIKIHKAWRQCPSSSICCVILMRHVSAHN